MIITIVRVIGTKEPVLVMAEAGSFEEMFHHVDGTCSPYDCEYKDVEISTKLAFTWDSSNEITPSCVVKSEIDEEMNSDDGWLEFPGMALDDITDAEGCSNGRPA